MESRLHTSPEQFSALLEFMERNGDISRPRSGTQGQLRADRLWQELTDVINNVGSGVLRTTEKWQEIWADWKTKTKKKSFLIRCLDSGTGGGPNTKIKLTLLEERMLSLLGPTSVEGQVTIEERGFAVAQASEPAEPLWPLSSAQDELPPAVQELPLVTEDIALQIEEDIVPHPSHWIAEGGRRDKRSCPIAPILPAPSSAPLSSRRSAPSTPRRFTHRHRRRRALISFERATNHFILVEKQRLQLEENRDKRVHDREIERERVLHEREMERLHVEAQRLEVRRTLLHQFDDIAQTLSEWLSTKINNQ